MEQNSLPTAVLDALTRIEKYYTGVIPWLARMYDPATHGFHLATSGKNDPAIDPAIEATSWGIKLLNTYTDAWPRIPGAVRAGMIEFFQARQEPESGLFIDMQGPANDREQARNQHAALDALEYLGVQPRYPHPSQNPTSVNEATAARMPAYMESVDAYLVWMQELPWETNSWLAGDRVQSSQQYIRMLPPEREVLYRTAALEYLESTQLESGLWASKLNFNSISGAFKVCLVYGAWKLHLPRAEAVVESIFDCYRLTPAGCPCFVRNPLSVLRTLSTYSPEMKAHIQAELVKNIDTITAAFGEFLCPDGAFSSSKGKSVVSFGGVVGSHGEFEGDSDGTLMMLIARKELYTIFHTSAPLLDTTHFWDWITGTLPTPEC